MKTRQLSILTSRDWGFSLSAPPKARQIGVLERIKLRLANLLWTMRFKTAWKRSSFLHHINKNL